MQDAIRLPMDFDALNKGDIISPEKLQEIIQERPGTTKFQLAVLGLRQQIMDELEARNKPATVVQDHGALRVLTDSEATVYNEEQFDQKMRGMRRVFMRLKDVRIDQLKDDEKKLHERRLLTQGRILQSIRNTKKELRLTHQRTTPVPAIE